MAVTGRIQPTVRRVASSASSVVTAPNRMSILLGVAAPADELVEVDDRPGQDQHRDDGQRPVDRRHPAAPGGDGRVEHERQDQCDQQEADPVDLRLDDAHDPVEGVERQPGGHHRDQPFRNAG